MIVCKFTQSKICLYSLYLLNKALYVNYDIILLIKEIELNLILWIFPYYVFYILAN